MVIIVFNKPISDNKTLAFGFYQANNSIANFSFSIMLLAIYLSLLLIIYTF
jgi:hypothetical protein